MNLHSKIDVNVVWIKRDIRSQDHLPLHLAEQDGIPYLIVFVFEPHVIQYKDTSLRHLQFQYQSILNVNRNLSKYNKEIIVFYAELPQVFEEILNQFKVKKVFSYQESGIRLTYQRDKKMSLYFKEHQIEWLQCQRDGIIRGIKNRQGWDKKWFESMHLPIITNQYSMAKSILFNHPFNIPQNLIESWSDYSNLYQPAGEDFAIKYLNSFMKERAINYAKHISKPQESRFSCSRLSPYLSWGNISVKQAYQMTLKYNQQLEKKIFGISSYQTRLKWHCHFIQKFEVECDYETKCVNSGYEQLSHVKNDLFIQAWKQGKTGFPLIDACMRCLINTGWINFRMRAMLVSFFCHHLDQDWRDGVYHLAQLFLDYEPGIHYTQFQMQAGTTGINTIRIYNPIKQSQEHDVNGNFIKQWLPELKDVPIQFIHQPYLMSELEQQMYHVKIGEDYPLPIIDYEVAAKYARNKIWGHKKHADVKKENERILITHTRRTKKKQRAIRIYLNEKTKFT